MSPEDALLALAARLESAGSDVDEIRAELDEAAAAFRPPVHPAVVDLICGPRPASPCGLHEWIDGRAPEVCPYCSRAADATRAHLAEVASELASSGAVARGRKRAKARAAEAA